MTYSDGGLVDREPPGWRRLCAELKAETDRDKFKALLAQMDALLRAHEKRQVTARGSVAPFSGTPTLGLLIEAGGKTLLAEIGGFPPVILALQK